MTGGGYMDDPENVVLAAQIRRELSQIVPIISRLTALPSNWNGDVVVISTEEFKGKKPFSCPILISLTQARQEARWRTLIHEALHSVSAGYNQSDYNDFTGWEEGVVEQLQRLLRPHILREMGVSVTPDVFVQQESAHLFNRRIDALERLRSSLKVPDSQSVLFYTELLSTPIKLRQGVLFNKGSQLIGQERAEFIRTFSKSNSILKDSA